MHFRAFWDENLNSSKKIQNSLKNDLKMSKNCLIFKISDVGWWTEMADNRPKKIPKVPNYSKFLPKILYHKKQKIGEMKPKQLPPPNWPIWGGGGGE